MNFAESVLQEFGAADSTFYADCSNQWHDIFPNNSHTHTERKGVQPGQNMQECMNQHISSCLCTTLTSSPYSSPLYFPILEAVLRIRICIRIRIRRIHMFLGLPDPHPDPLVRDMDPDPDPSLIKQNSKKSIDSYCFVTSL